MTGRRLEGWVMLLANTELREEIYGWAAAMHLDLDLVATMAFRMLDKQCRSAHAALGRKDAPPPTHRGSPASPCSSLLANAFAVPEDSAWDVADGYAEGSACGRRLDAGRNPSIESSASVASELGDFVMLRSRSL